jgi:hypothetical protein
LYESAKTLLPENKTTEDKIMKITSNLSAIPFNFISKTPLYPD